MASEDKSGFAVLNERYEHERNRSHIVKPDDDDGFAISFRDIKHVVRRDFASSRFSDEADLCVVEFLIRRGNQEIMFPVYIERETVEPMDYLKEAAHRLHLDLVKLAEQTSTLKLREQDAKDG